MADFRDFLQGASNGAAANLSAPVDGLAWLLRKAGLPIPDAPIGGSDWMEQKGLTAVPQNQNMGLLGEAVGGVTGLLGAAKAPQIAKGLLQSADNLMAPRVMNPQTGAVVWHGSPHKFDKFDASKIGTGEGAQAYGHGLYLAESPEVAGQYADNVRAVHPMFIKDAKQLLREMETDNWKRYKPSEIDEQRKVVARLLERADAKSLYKVNLPDEHIAKMLDWDKPLSQQHPDVQKILEPLGYSNKAQVSQYEDDLLASLYGDSTTPLNKIRDPMGSDIARGGGVFDSRAQIEKAKRLQELGIPGIRYLDGVSRGTGQGTSNFVVFPGNEGLLSILERNGAPIK